MNGFSAAMSSADRIGIVVSRADVEACDIEPTLGALSRFVERPETTRAMQGRIDIAFYGYADDARELCEIPEVRRFVERIDTAFPYWLYFLSRNGAGLITVAFCLLPVFATPEARERDSAPYLGRLVTDRWGPALMHLAGIAGESESDAEAILFDALEYFREGPRGPLRLDTAEP